MRFRSITKPALVNDFEFWLNLVPNKLVVDETLARWAAHPEEFLRECQKILDENEEARNALYKSRPQ